MTNHSKLEDKQMYFLLVRMVISSFHLCNAYISLHAVGVSPGQCWLVQSAIYSVFSVCLFLSRASLPSLLRVFNFGLVMSLEGLGTPNIETSSGESSHPASTANPAGMISVQVPTSLCMQNKLIIHSRYCFVEQYVYPREPNIYMGNLYLRDE